MSGKPKPNNDHGALLARLDQGFSLVLSALEKQKPVNITVQWPVDVVKALDRIERRQRWMVDALELLLKGGQGNPELTELAKQLAEATAPLKEAIAENTVK